MKRKQKILDRLTASLKKKGAKQIRSVQDENVDPRSLSFKWNKKKYTPDVVAIYPDKKDIFCVESKINKSNIPDLISKWILFGLEARKNNGKFFLIVPPEKQKYCQELIKSKQLSANLLPAMT